MCSSCALHISAATDSICSSSEQFLLVLQAAPILQICSFKSCDINMKRVFKRMKECQATFVRASERASERASSYLLLGEGLHDSNVNFCAQQ
jgi:hypothetical protein